MKFKLIFTFLLAITISLSGIAQTIGVETAAYINQYKNIAMQEQIRTGVPAAIKLAQAILESQTGKSRLATEANNHFGIKCKIEWKGPKIYHNDDATGECFRVYENAETSFIDHSNFLKTRTHYAFLFKLDVNLSDSCDYCKITNIISVLKYVDNRHAEKSLKCFDQLRK